MTHTPAPSGMAPIETGAGTPTTEKQDFIRQIVRQDLASGKHTAIRTRFPPEPNGYLHIGHAKAICLNFGIAAEFAGRCNLRFDDTNPAKEDPEFVAAIQDDVRWLGFEWAELRHASDYFEVFYLAAEKLIRQGDAFVCDLTPEQIREYRGTLTEPGRNSPSRDRSVEENLDLFRRMRAGEFPDGSHVLRARIDMAHPNMVLRDPVLYRILHVEHHRTGDAWCIYPTYDWAHGQTDALEGTTHSLCTLEFEGHRPLYDWLLDHLDLPGDRPQQTEFARLALTWTTLSKRKLLRLVEQGLVDGWDDPRLPTLRGLRRLGYPAAAIRNFVDHIGVAKVNGTHEIELLESFVRDELNRTAVRRMAVLNPLKVVVENYPEGASEELEAVNNPEDPGAGTRRIPWSRELWIEADDFLEDPPKKFFRLSPGREVRLRYGYFVTCTDVVKDAEGNVVELRCTYDPATGGGNAPDGRKVKATLHWVSAAHAVDVEVRRYERLFTEPFPDADGRDPLDLLNPSARTIVTAKAEPALADAAPGAHLQFERLGYFAADPEQPLVFHRTVGLKDDWAKIAKRTA